MHNATTVEHFEGGHNQLQYPARIGFGHRPVLLQVITKVAAVAVLHRYAYEELPELKRLDDRLESTNEKRMLKGTHDSVLFERRISLDTVENVHALECYTMSGHSVYR